MIRKDIEEEERIEKKKIQRRRKYREEGRIEENKGEERTVEKGQKKSTDRERRLYIEGLNQYIKLDQMVELEYPTAGFRPVKQNTQIGREGSLCKFGNLIIRNLYVIFYIRFDL